MDWAKAQQNPITQIDVNDCVKQWPPAIKADKKLYDFRYQTTDGLALTIVENHAGQGYESWRVLCKRFDPMTEHLAFGSLASLLRVDKYTYISEVPARL